MTRTTATTALTGDRLLQKLKEIQLLPRREKAKICGYYTITKNNQTRINTRDFLDAIVEAKGITLAQETKVDGRGREATYRVSVHRNGQIVIGSTYTQAMGLHPGDAFDIRLGYKHIHLNTCGRNGAKY